MFPSTIQASYRIVETRYGGGDSETTIPLGSWRKGGGLDGSKGHVYEYGSGWAGVWIKGQGPRQRMDRLRVDFANLVPMQIGEREGTFRVPMSDLERLLPILGAKRQRKPTEAVLRTLQKARDASSIAKPRRNDRAERA